MMIKDKLEKEDILMIEENPLFLATVNKRKNPHSIIVAYVKVAENKLVITDNYMVKTIENLKNNKNVSLSIYNKKWTGLFIDGVARYYKNGKYYRLIRSLKENKKEPCKGAIVVTIRSIKKMF